VGFSIADDGTVAPLSLDGLSGRELTTALRVYVERARRGDADAPLVAGTAKDLAEATARHVLIEQGGSYRESMGFQGTLHNALAAIVMTPVGRRNGKRSSSNSTAIRRGVSSNAST
jgi:hypothetical protein